jgi:multidrug efflux system membrane fusion protein
MNRQEKHPDPLAALAGLLLAVFVAVVLTACGSDAAEHAGPPPAPAVSVAEPIVRDVNGWDEFTGRVEAVETVEIRPRVSGYIDDIRYTEGREVRKGDVLFVIDPRPYRAELARAEADLARARAEAELAQSEVARARKLLEARAISQEEHDQRIATGAQTRASVRAVEAAVETARLNLEFTVVRSPIAGRAGRALVTEGNLVGPGAIVLTTVVSLDPVYVYFEGDEQVYLRSAELARRADATAAPPAVFVGLANEDGFPHEGRLDFVDNQVNPATGTIRSRAVLANADRTFTPGLFARVKLVGSAAASTILVDDKAILTDQDRKYVYVLGPDNKALRRDLKLGRIVAGLRVVSEGLSAGDKVIVHGAQKIFFPGMAVQPTAIAMGDPPPSPGPSGHPLPQAGEGTASVLPSPATAGEGLGERVADDVRKPT